MLETLKILTFGAYDDVQKHSLLLNLIAFFNNYKSFASIQADSDFDTNPNLTLACNTYDCIHHHIRVPRGGTKYKRFSLTCVMPDSRKMEINDVSLTGTTYYNDPLSHYVSGDKMQAIVFVMDMSQNVATVRAAYETFTSSMLDNLPDNYLKHLFYVFVKCPLDIEERRQSIQEVTRAIPRFYQRYFFFVSFPTAPVEARKRAYRHNIKSFQKFLLAISEAPYQFVIEGLLHVRPSPSCCQMFLTDLCSRIFRFLRRHTTSLKISAFFCLIACVSFFGYFSYYSRLPFTD